MSDAYRGNLIDITPKTKLFGFYRGTVVDTNDPLQRGRCRIRIFGIHTQLIEKKIVEGIPDEELPWAEQVAPCIGGTSGNGVFAVPTKGTVVWCFFDRGDHMHPVYFGAQFGATVVVRGEGALSGNNPAQPDAASPAQSAAEGTPEEKTDEEQREINAQYDGGEIRIDSKTGKLDPASIDMSHINPVFSNVDLTGLDPRVAEDLVNLSHDYYKITGEKLPISEGWRSFNEQDRLFKKYGYPRAAYAGTSNHGYGRAIDINKSSVSSMESKLKAKGTSLAELLNKNHFSRPLSHENWHLESKTVPRTTAMAADGLKRDSGRKSGAQYLIDSGDTTTLAKYGYGTLVAEK